MVSLRLFQAQQKGNTDIYVKIAYCKVSILLYITREEEEGILKYLYATDLKCMKTFLQNLQLTLGTCRHMVSPGSRL